MADSTPESNSVTCVERPGSSGSTHSSSKRRVRSSGGLAGDAESGEAPDVWSAEVPVLAAAAAASVGGRVALGPNAGARVRRYGDPPEDEAPTRVGPCHADADGFDLHAGLMVPAGHRDRLERLCRYALRPPLAQELLHVDR